MGANAITRSGVVSLGAGLVMVVCMAVFGVVSAVNLLFVDLALAFLAAVGPEHGTRAQRALRFVLAEPRVSCAVFGMAELGHLEEALAGAAMGPLPEAALAALREVWDRDFGSMAG